MESPFSKLADKFVAQVESRDIGPASEVAILVHCVDQQEIQQEPFRVSLVPTTIVGASVPHANAFAMIAHKGTIIQNIRSIVGATPPDYRTWREGPPFPIRVTDFTLVID